MDYYKRRAERIRQEVPIARFLSDCGYDVDPSLGGHQEQQFGCDLHGSNDEKPSARVFCKSNSWHCWGCQKSRDAVQTLRDKHSVSFGEALSAVERAYGLAPLPFETEEEEDAYLTRAQGTPLNGDFESEKERASSLLFSLTQEQSLDLARQTTLWEGYDKVVWLFQEQRLGAREAAKALETLRERVMSFISEDE